MVRKDILNKAIEILAEDQKREEIMSTDTIQLCRDNSLDNVEKSQEVVSNSSLKVPFMVPKLALKDSSKVWENKAL